MKKLFSTMLAATMVAGMAVTSFAYTPEKSIELGEGEDFDYALEGAYNDKGEKLETGDATKLDSGDKIYYPILVSGEELNDQKDGTVEEENEKAMYYATKASEVKTLKASVKDEIGGKYIDSASIVKKDISIPVTGTETIGKIYCVEVKLADYYKTSETEVDFNIKLKDGGKTAFDTDDDILSESFFNGTFDLGADGEKFDFNKEGGKEQNGAKATKFKKGDLEIEIGKDTTTVQLDEVVNKEGEDEDVTNIYIENDDSIDDAFTFDVKASSQDDLYLELNQDADKELSLANPKADLTFFNFPGKPAFDFAGTATFAVEDEDQDYYFYEITDGELVESKAKYNEEDGVFELRTNKLGSYVIADKELEAVAKEDEKEENDAEDKDTEEGGGDLNEDKNTNADGTKPNANTGAADLIGVASALAVVSIAAAGVVALKK